MLKVYVRLFGDMALFCFVSVAAVGAALAAAVDVTTHHAHISDLYGCNCRGECGALYQLHMDTLRVSVLIWNY